MGVPIEDCHSFYERLVSKIAITDLPPEWIALSEGFRRDRIVLAAKRVIDVIVAFLGLLLGMPLALMTALAIKLESSGPIFYRQERVGQNEKHFTLFEVSLHDTRCRGESGTRLGYGKRSESDQGRSHYQKTQDR